MLSNEYMTKAKSSRNESGELSSKHTQSTEEGKKTKLIEDHTAGCQH